MKAEKRPEALMHYRFEQRKKGGDVYKLYLYDDISKYGDFDWETWEYKESETSAKYIRDRLDEIPENSTIEVHVNSRGGDVGEGTTISSQLRQKADSGNCLIIGYVDGYAYSIAMTIMMACNEIRMMPGSTMFLHYPWMACCGNAEDLRAFADQLDGMGDASVALYMERAAGHLTEDELREMMQAETCLSPEACLKYGFCDVIEGQAPDKEDDPGDDDAVDDPEKDTQDDDTEKKAVKQSADDLESRIMAKVEKMILNNGIRDRPEGGKQEAEQPATVRNTLIEAMRRVSVDK